MFVSPECTLLEYSGRIDFSQPEAPVFVYPCSYVRMRFTGERLAVFLENHQAYWDNDMGYMMDGKQYGFRLEKGGKHAYELDVPAQEGALGDFVHECMIFKRMDACHHVTFYGMELADGSRMVCLPDLPDRRMEFYGDSVSAGEVSEAVDYAGKEDPVHNGEFSNSWYSYAWMTARKLNAQIHDIAQGGIALLDHTGWFGEPELMGMESVYDKITYNPKLGASREWDFTRYVPHVAVIAIGQNDSNPRDYMVTEPDGEKSAEWKRHYKRFVEKIREHYPKAVIILATTILCHDPHWDEAVEEVCRQLNDPHVHHFLYSRNGKGTPGHIRIQEAEQMSDELSQYIRSLGEEVWSRQE